MGEQTQSAQAQRAQHEAELAHAWGRYNALRSRKSVRAALALAELRRKAQERLRPDARQAPITAPAPAPPPAAAAVDPRMPARGAPAPAVEEVAHCWPLGHFYSPVPDTVALAGDEARERIWPHVPRETNGVDWREQEQVQLVRNVIARQPEFVFATAPTGDPTEYHTQNPFFSRLDAWALQGMLRWLRPARVVEVGSGWSSLVTARVNRDVLDGNMELTCIEPYPAEYLRDGVAGLTRLIASPVQHVPLETFLQLDAGDVLFIDSSHVMKTGSDVQFLYHEVLPRLHSGVVVHVHDVFLPRDYPQDWVMSGRGWNEQYVLQSFLAFNSAFEILLAIGWMNHFRPDVLAEAIPGFPATTPDGGGSFWMRRRS